MTEQSDVCKQKSRSSPFTVGRLCFGWLGLFCLLLMLRNSEIAIEYMTRGLRLCAKTVIPSLFPFMVIAELLVSSGIGTALIRPIAPLFKPIFRLPEVGCCAVIMGMLCGFPIGARCAISALKSNLLSREEAQRVLLFSMNPSTAFLISAVGISLWGNKRFGVSLCITVLLSQWIIGLLFTHVFSRKSKQPPIEKAITNESTYPNAARLFTQAISSSCLGTLNICAYVVFFSALSGTVNLVLDGAGAETSLKAIIACVLELSSGVSAANGLPSPILAAVLSAFACGWAGLSVHCQLLSICDGYGLNTRSYFIAKLLQGLLCGALLWTWIQLDPSLLISANRC